MIFPAIFLTFSDENMCSLSSLATNKTLDNNCPQNVQASEIAAKSLAVVVSNTCPTPVLWLPILQSLSNKVQGKTTIGAETEGIRAQRRVSRPLEILDPGTSSPGWRSLLHIHIHMYTVSIIIYIYTVYIYIYILYKHYIILYYIL